MVPKKSIIDTFISLKHETVLEPNCMSDRTSKLQFSAILNTLRNSRCVTKLTPLKWIYACAIQILNFLIKPDSSEDLNLPHCE